jgi:hypothetical protein
MDGDLLTGLKLLGFTGIGVGFCIWQLWSLKRLEKERAARVRDAAREKDV